MYSHIDVHVSFTTWTQFRHCLVECSFTFQSTEDTTYSLIKCDNRYPLARTVKEGKRGVVERIIRYNEKRDKCTVEYGEGTVDEIPAKNVREEKPLKLSFMERQFWAKESEAEKKVPKAIRAIWLGI